MCIRTISIKRSLFMLKQVVLVRMLTTEIQPVFSFSDKITIHNYKTKITSRLSLMLQEGSFFLCQFPMAMLNFNTI